MSDAPLLSRRSCLSRWPLAAAAVAPLGAAAQRIVVEGQGAGKSTLGFAVQAGSGTAEQQYFRNLQYALQVCGYFTLTQAGSSSYRIEGQVGPSSASLRAVDASGREVGRTTASYQASTGRAAALRSADELIEALLGKPGMFSARVALVGTRSGRKELWLCDALGGQVQQVTRDGVTCLAPTWHPDGQRLFYTSYIGGMPSILEVNIVTGKRRKLAAYGGTNLNGTVSPDGRKLALVLSKDGKPELYVHDLATGRDTRLTRSGSTAPKSSPSWSPDGRRLVYVSGESGNPHLYVLSATGGSPKRITRASAENVSPNWGPSGVVYSAREGRQYRVKVLDPDRGGTPADITPARDYSDFEDPYWAADGRHVYVGRTASYASSLYLLDTQGEPGIALLQSNPGDWYAPACSG